MASEAGCRWPARPRHRPAARLHQHLQAWLEAAGPAGSEAPVGADERQNWQAATACHQSGAVNPASLHTIAPPCPCLPACSAQRCPDRRCDHQPQAWQKQLLWPARTVRTGSLVGRRVSTEEAMVAYACVLTAAMLALGFSPLARRPYEQRPACSSRPLNNASKPVGSSPISSWGSSSHLLCGIPSADTRFASLASTTLPRHLMPLG